MANSPYLSKKAAALIDELIESGDSQSLAVGECLDTIAGNDEESATDEFLLVCAEEIKTAAEYAISVLRKGKTP